jgi:hypothetical protein
MEEKENKKGKLFGKIPYLTVVGIVVGIIGGYLYYSQIGCNSGTCAITSNPYMSMGWGGAMGYLVFDMFNGKKKDEKEDS